MKMALARTQLGIIALLGSLMLSTGAFAAAPEDEASLPDARSSDGQYYGDDPRPAVTNKLPASVPRDCAFFSTYGAERTFRQDQGLARTVDRGRATDVAFGFLRVMPEEGSRIRHAAMERARSNTAVLNDMARRELGETFIGIHWNSYDGFTVSATRNAQIDNGLADRIAEAANLDRDVITLRIVDGGVSERRWRYLNAYVSAHAAELYSAGYHSSEVDESCGHMLIYVLPGTLRKAIDVLLLGSAEPGSYSILESEPPQDAGRDDHHNPYIGGTRVEMTAAGTCTASIGWTKGVQRWALTAGHCTGMVSGDPRTNYWDLFTQNELWHQGTQELNDVRGQTTYVRYGGEIDAAIVWLDAEYTQLPQTISHGGLTGSDTHLGMGWWEWDPALPTEALGGVYAGDVIRQSGVNWTAPRSGNLISKTFTSTGVGNINNLWSHFHDLFRATTDAAPGDSGGTVWRVDGAGSTWISGVLKGITNGGDNMHYTHISWVRSRFGLTAPTGMS